VAEAFWRCDKRLKAIFENARCVMACNALKSLGMGVRGKALVYSDSGLSSPSSWDFRVTFIYPVSGMTFPSTESPVAFQVKVS
jgi:hypothetical protein